MHLGAVSVWVICLTRGCRYRSAAYQKVESTLSSDDPSVLTGSPFPDEQSCVHSVIGVSPSFGWQEIWC